jgi:hypothetical protein
MANVSYYEKKINSLETCRRVLTLAIQELGGEPDKGEIDRLQRDLITRRDSIVKQLHSAKMMLAAKMEQQDGERA